MGMAAIDFQLLANAGFPPATFKPGETIFASLPFRWRARRLTGYAAHLLPKARERSQTSRLAIVAGDGHDRSRSFINVAA